MAAGTVPQHGAAVDLVSQLVARPNQRMRLDALSAALGVDSMDVMGTVADFGSLFKLSRVDGHVGVSLVRWPKLCFRYSTNGKGCKARECEALHVCLKHLLGACGPDNANAASAPCGLNHHFHLGADPPPPPALYGVAFRNENLLKPFDLAGWPPAALRALLVTFEASLPLPSDVCAEYNNDSGGGCPRGADCPAFHGCADFVVGGGCSAGRGACRLSHEPWKEPNRRAVFASVGSNPVGGVSTAKGQHCARTQFRKLLLDYWKQQNSTEEGEVTSTQTFGAGSGKPKPNASSTSRSPSPPAGNDDACDLADGGDNSNVGAEEGVDNERGDRKGTAPEKDDGAVSAPDVVAGIRVKAKADRIASASGVDDVARKRLPDDPSAPIAGPASTSIAFRDNGSDGPSGLNARPTTTGVGKAVENAQDRDSVSLISASTDLVEKRLVVLLPSNDTSISQGSPSAADPLPIDLTTAQSSSSASCPPRSIPRPGKVQGVSSCVPDAVGLPATKIVEKTDSTSGRIAPQCIGQDVIPLTSVALSSSGPWPGPGKGDNCMNVDTGDGTSKDGSGVKRSPPLSSSSVCSEVSKKPRVGPNTEVTASSNPQPGPSGVRARNDWQNTGDAVPKSSREDVATGVVDGASNGTKSAKSSRLSKKRRPLTRKVLETWSIHRLRCLLLKILRLGPSNSENASGPLSKAVMVRSACQKALVENGMSVKEFFLLRSVLRRAEKKLSVQGKLAVVSGKNKRANRRKKTKARKEKPSMNLTMADLDGWSVERLRKLFLVTVGEYRFGAEKFRVPQPVLWISPTSQMLTVKGVSGTDFQVLRSALRRAEATTGLPPGPNRLPPALVPTLSPYVLDGWSFDDLLRLAVDMLAAVEDGGRPLPETASELVDRLKAGCRLAVVRDEHALTEDGFDFLMFALLRREPGWGIPRTAANPAPPSFPDLLAAAVAAAAQQPGPSSGKVSNTFVSASKKKVGVKRPPGKSEVSKTILASKRKKRAKTRPSGGRGKKPRVVFASKKRHEDGASTSDVKGTASDVSGSGPSVSAAAVSGPSVQSAAKYREMKATLNALEAGLGAAAGNEAWTARIRNVIANLKWRLQNYERQFLPLLNPPGAGAAAWLEAEKRRVRERLVTARMLAEQAAAKLAAGADAAQPGPSTSTSGFGARNFNSLNSQKQAGTGISSSGPSTSGFGARDLNGQKLVGGNDSSSGSVSDKQNDHNYVMRVQSGPSQTGIPPGTSSALPGNSAGPVVSSSSVQHGPPLIRSISLPSRPAPSTSASGGTGQPPPPVPTAPAQTSGPSTSSAPSGSVGVAAQPPPPLPPRAPTLPSAATSGGGSGAPPPTTTAAPAMTTYRPRVIVPRFVPGLYQTPVPDGWLRADVSDAEAAHLGHAASRVMFRAMEGDVKLDLFPNWNVILDIRTAYFRSSRKIRLPEVDAAEIVKFAEKYPLSKLPTCMERDYASAVKVKPGEGRDEVWKLRSHDALLDLTQILTECGAYKWKPNDDGTVTAWRYREGPDSEWQLLTGTFNGITFGLAASVLLEEVRDSNPEAVVRLHSFGLVDCAVNLATMELTHPSGKVWQLERSTVSISPTVEPSWIPMLASGLPRAVIVPIRRDDLQFVRELAPRIHEGKVFYLGKDRDRLYESHIIQVFRVQNPRRLARFRDRGDEMRAMYAPFGAEAPLKTALLFHGTRPASLASICADNFEWRRAGESVGARFGKGVYFSPYFHISAAYAAECVPSQASPFPTARRRFVFAADVHVGLAVVGNKDMAYPPIWRNDIKYDTAVDKLSNPLVAVKFETDEMYPKYLIEFEVRVKRSPADPAAGPATSSLSSAAGTQGTQTGPVKT